MLRPSAFPGSENVRSTTTYTSVKIQLRSTIRFMVKVLSRLVEFLWLYMYPSPPSTHNIDIHIPDIDLNHYVAAVVHQHRGSKERQFSFVIELLDAGVSVNGLDKAGNAPLHWACRGGHSEVVAHLLAHSPAVNAGNKLGDTPLHLAAWGGNVSVVDLLLAHPETRVDIRNNSGSTPLDLAKSDGVAAALLNFIGAGGADGLMGDDDEDDNEDDTGIHPEAVPHK
ncbi:hypothetical protein BSLG_009729 [Batrachochytrium salamandrivorans]|nr:hypothetical protein BSLG_009729 [Batrachochytrium salamandrivorans]